MSVSFFFFFKCKIFENYEIRRTEMEQHILYLVFMNEFVFAY